ncbi:15705_t:CDS:2 [Acaulospora morrowiae]|uniref:15705_t:CDS:1 n=1 Tax=Acaulospora morrowiae TaxID=94023 RepID=A0A9N9BDL9_9GLOM|nr:15705_t:CDS:2 [Acaulospora morrowiae]
MSESSCWVDELERSINNLKLEVYDYDNFENFNLIGEGSFGKVYKAVIKTTKMTVAMKNINVDNKEAAEAFINELKLQQAVNKHINIIRFFGISRKECRKEDPKERPNIHEVLDKLHSLKDTSTITTIIVNSDGNIGDSKQLGLTFDVLDIENYYNNNDPGIENDDGNNDPDIENSVSSDLCIEDSSDVNFNSDDVAQNSELLTALITVVRNELNSGIMTKKRLKECIQENIDSKQKTLKELLVYLQNHSQQEPNFSDAATSLGEGL